MFFFTSVSWLTPLRILSMIQEFNSIQLENLLRQTTRTDFRLNETVSQKLGSYKNQNLYQLFMFTDNSPTVPLAAASARKLACLSIL